MSDARKYGITFGYVSVPETIAIGTVLPFVCTILTVLRIVARRQRTGRSGWEDWFIILGLISVIGMGVSLVIGVALHAFAYPLPRSSRELMAKTIAIHYKLLYILEILMILAYGSVKISITFFYRRLFVTRKYSFFDLFTKFILIILGLWTLLFTFTKVFGCGVHFSENYSIFYNPKDTYCTLKYKFPWVWAMVISDAILDLVVILAPLPLVWKLKLPLIKKLGITLILLLSITSMGASITRIVWLKQLQAINGKKVNIDILQNNTNGMYWAMFEAGLALIAACLPVVCVSRRGKNNSRGANGQDKGRKSTILSWFSWTSRTPVNSEADGVVEKRKSMINVVEARMGSEETLNHDRSDTDKFDFDFQHEATSTWSRNTSINEAERHV